jgi:uncharacterized protein (DUF433 family)
VIALWNVAVALGPARIAIAVPAVLIRSLSPAARTAPERRRTIVIAVAGTCSGSARVVTAIGVPGAAVASTARPIVTSFLIARVEVTRVEIKHGYLRLNQSSGPNARYNGHVDWCEHITVNPAVLHGTACIRGTRIPVATVLSNLADGLAVEEILKSYPTLTAAGIQAALAYATDLAQDRVLPPLA